MMKTTVALFATGLLSLGSWNLAKTFEVSNLIIENRAVLAAGDKANKADHDRLEKMLSMMMPRAEVEIRLNQLEIDLRRLDLRITELQQKLQK